MLRDEEVITLADEATDAFHALPDAAKSMEMWKLYIARAVERAAYERAAQECDPHEDDDRIDRQIKREIAERIRALGRQQ